MDYYVSSKGNDSHDGATPATAWKTLARIGEVELGPGDRVRLDAESTWHESLRLSARGAEGKPVVVEGYEPPAGGVAGDGTATGGGTAAEVGGGSGGRGSPGRRGWEDGFTTLRRPRIVWETGPVVRIVDSSHVELVDIEVECATTETLYPELAGVDDPSSVKDVPRHPQDEVNIGILVTTSHDAPRTGITIKGCFVHGRGPNQNSEGILVTAETTADAREPTLRDVVIRDNLVTDVGWRGIGTGSRTIDPDSHGIPWIAIENLLMEGNAARTIGLHGICAFNAHDVVMRRNLVDGGGQYHGVAATWGPAGLWPWSCANVLIELNEVTNMFDGNTGADATGIDIDWNSHSVIVRRNHCYGNMGCGIVTMSCRDSVIEENRVEGNLAKVNIGPGQIGLSDYQTAQGPHAITGVTNLAVRGNLLILDRDNTTAISTMTHSEGAWNGVTVTGNRVVYFDHARDQYAYDVVDGTAVDRFDGNRFYGIDADGFEASTPAGRVDFESWKRLGYDADARFAPLDGSEPGPVVGARWKRSAGKVELGWEAVNDSQSGVHHYNVYRGSDPAFPARYLTLVGQPESTAFVDEDPPARPAWYKIEAEDACGNRSGIAAVVPVEP